MRLCLYYSNEKCRKLSDIQSINENKLKKTRFFRPGTHQFIYVDVKIQKEAVKGIILLL